MSKTQNMAQALSDVPSLEIALNASNADASSTATELLKKIWRELLRVPDINPGDDFFDDLGGDSLVAIRMLQRVGREYGEELLEPDVIYTASSFGDFTKAVTDALARRSSSAQTTATGA